MEILIKDCLIGGAEKSILVSDGKISEVGKPKTTDYVINAKGMAALPGLVNTHTHLAMTMFRGMADDLPLSDWLNKHIWPAEGRYLGEEFCRTGSLLGCLEMIKSGTTCFADQYFFMDSTAEAVRESGLRAYLAQAVIDFKTPQYEAGDALKVAGRFLRSNPPDEMIKPMVGPHAPYTCCEETLIASKELAQKHAAMLHIHISETKSEAEQIKKEKGKRPVEYLDSIGFLGGNVLAAHCVYLNEHEIQLMKKNNTTISHNPTSNMKLASGVAPVAQMLAAGIPVTLGTDGCASNNNLDMFGEMRQAALLHKVAALDPTAVSARQALQMATTNAYKSLGLNLGLEVGRDADIILVDLKKPHLRPVHNIESHLVYSASGADVDTVIVAGKILMERRQVKTLNEDEILEKAEEIRP